MREEARLEIHATVTGPYFVDGEIDFFGEIDGNAYVRPRGVFNLYGVVIGDLYVQPGAIVTIHGQVTGCVENGGESVTIYGRVGGIVNLNRERPAVVGFSATIGVSGQ